MSAPLLCTCSAPTFVNKYNCIFFLLLSLFQGILEIFVGLGFLVGPVLGGVLFTVSGLYSVQLGEVHRHFCSLSNAIDQQ